MIDNRYIPLFEAIICSICLMIFSCFIHSGFPVRIISFVALLVPSYIFGKNLHSLSDFRKITGVPTSFLMFNIYNIVGFMLGMFLAVLYRWYLGLSLMPTSGLHHFVIVAALIGALEELIFRGFIQEYAKSINAPFSIFFSAISHTGYKCCLFIIPLAAADIDIKVLAFWTLGAGILFGTLKHFSKSIVPPLIAHVMFDIFVYVEFIDAPWWVW